MGDKSSVVLCNCGKQLKLDFDFLKTEVSKLDLVDSVAVHDLLCQEEGLATLGDLISKCYI